MSLNNIDDLPESISDGQVGHEQDHENIHNGLKSLKEKVLKNISIESELPLATESTRGNFLIKEKSGEPDSVYVCIYDGSSDYVWSQIKLT